ncbi:MAG: glycogen synthase [Anaerolineaceae bacterium]|nr:glycogen synthase [Anaerolineaceae bacterium]
MPIKKKINVLFASAEAEPFVKIGGLGDVAGTLPIAIQLLSKSDTNIVIDIRLVIPYHAIIRTKNFSIHHLGKFTVKATSKTFTCDVHYTDETGIPVYLLDGDLIDNKSPVYHADPIKDGEKYVFFSICCLELAKYLNWKVDILHCNDWHTSPAIQALHTRYKTDPLFINTKSILSLHNMPYMGWGAQKALTEFGLPASRSKILPDWAKHTPLPLGILYADEVIAVSPTYAKEILTPEFSCTLDSFLMNRSKHIIGILNGIDSSIWDPSSDPDLISTYDFTTLEKKTDNKISLNKKFNLDIDPSIPLLTIISRMDEQKGIDIGLKGLLACIEEKWQAIILGTGNKDIEKMAMDLSLKYPHKIKTITQFDAHLAHQLYAGADIFLMPSRYEPCGISQMIAMNYGTIPVARATGGLKDTIIQYKHNKIDGTGFLFKKAFPSALAYALRKALKVYNEKSTWRILQENGMKKDFSWNKSAMEYVKVYQSLIK